MSLSEELDVIPLNGTTISVPELEEDIFNLSADEARQKLEDRVNAEYERELEALKKKHPSLYTPESMAASMRNHLAKVALGEEDFYATFHFSAQDPEHAKFHRTVFDLFAEVIQLPTDERLPEDESTIIRKVGKASLFALATYYDDELGGVIFTSSQKVSLFPNIDVPTIELESLYPLSAEV